MKIALTVWDGWISPVFDVCREALVLEIEGKNIVSTTKVDLAVADPRQKISEPELAQPLTKERRP